MRSEDETREEIRQLRDYGADSDRPSEITIANVGSVKVRIPRRQHRAIGWSVFLVLLTAAGWIAAKIWTVVR